MTCQERRDLILLYAADALEPAERDELRAHLSSGCPSCAGALAEAEAIMAQIPQALDPVEPSPQSRDRLMQRVLATPKRQDAPLRITPPRITSPAPRAAASSNWTRYALAASLLLATGLAYLLFSQRQSWQRQQDALQVALADRNATIGQLQSMIDSPQLKLIDLAGQQTMPKCRGRVFWDMDRNQWHVYVFDLFPPPRDKVYELWYLTKEGGTIAAGQLQVDRDGRGDMVLALPRDIGTISGAGISEEKAGQIDPRKPNGPIHLLGT